MKTITVAVEIGTVKYAFTYQVEKEPTKKQLKKIVLELFENFYENR